MIEEPEHADRLASSVFASELSARMSSDDEAEVNRALASARTLSNWATSRRYAVVVTLECASADAKFSSLIASADRSRDNQDWPAAEWYYWRALQLYPLHRGYKTQYAHTLKEQGKFQDAEQFYREAVALGDASSDLMRHLRFAAEKSRHGVNTSTLADIAAYWDGRADDRPLMAPPTGADIVALGGLLLERTAWRSEEISQILDRCPSQAAVVALFMQRPEFVQKNRALLTFLVETI